MHNFFTVNSKYNNGYLFTVGKALEKQFLYPTCVKKKKQDIHLFGGNLKNVLPRALSNQAAPPARPTEHLLRSPRRCELFSRLSFSLSLSLLLSHSFSLSLSRAKCTPPVYGPGAALLSLWPGWVASPSGAPHHTPPRPAPPRPGAVSHWLVGRRPGRQPRAPEGKMGFSLKV